MFKAKILATYYIVEAGGELSANAKSWLASAIDSDYSYHSPSPAVIKELAKFKPAKSITVYRGLLFSVQEFVKFLKTNKVSSKQFTLKSDKSRTVSWSHSKQTATKFARYTSSGGSSFLGTLNALDRMGGGKAIDGDFGVLLRATLDPKDIIVDATEMKGLKTKTYAVSDEVFAFPRPLSVEIDALYTPKGKVNIEKIIDRYLGLTSKDADIEAELKYIDESSLGDSMSIRQNLSFNRNYDKERRLELLYAWWLVGTNSYTRERLKEGVKIDELRKKLKPFKEEALKVFASDDSLMEFIEKRFKNMKVTDAIQGYSTKLGGLVEKKFKNWKKITMNNIHKNVITLRSSIAYEISRIK